MSDTTANKIVIVTGASRGIGAATAALAATRGYAVCVNYRSDAAGATATVDEIRRTGGRAIAVKADVTDERAVVAKFETLNAELGTATALVNNAGVLETQARVEAMDAARLYRVLGVNVVGTFLCAREAVKRMSTRRGGV